MSWHGPKVGLKASTNKMRWWFLLLMTCKDSLSHHAKKCYNILNRKLQASGYETSWILRRQDRTCQNMRWDQMYDQISWSKRVSQVWWLKILQGCKYTLLVCRAQVRPPLEHRKTKCNFEWLYTGHTQQAQMDLRWYISVSTTSDEASGIAVLYAASRTVSKPFQKINNPKKTPDSFLCLQVRAIYSKQLKWLCYLALITVKKDRNNQFGSFIYNFFQLSLQLDWAHCTPVIYRE